MAETSMSFRLLFRQGFGPTTRVRVLAGALGAEQPAGVLALPTEAWAGFAAALMVGARMVSPPSHVQVEPEQEMLVPGRLHLVKGAPRG